MTTAHPERPEDPSRDEQRFAPPGGAGAPGAASGERRTSGKAIAALVTGILSLLIAGILLGLVAVALGVMARREIAAQPQLGGSGMALAGMITGALGFVLAVVILIIAGSAGVIG